MREIKFRAWQKHHRKMLPVKTIDFNRNTITVDYGEKTIPRVNTFDMENFELMQYTGLKDKNGVEIYEGDMIKVDNGIGYKAHVYFRNGAFRRMPHGAGEASSDYLNCYSYGSGDYEVIGNIHDTKAEKGADDGR